jgi:hypothetical protein
MVRIYVVECFIAESRCAALARRRSKSRSELISGATASTAHLTAAGLRPEVFGDPGGTMRG